MTGSPWHMAFDMVWKSAFFYFLLLVLLRLMGKREVSSLTPLDLVVSVMLAEAAVISIEDGKIPLLVGAAPVALLAFLQISLAWLSLKSPRVRDLLEGHPTILVHKGVLDERALRRSRININELLSSLRLKDLNNIQDVEYAILEPSGRISVVPAGNARVVENRDLQLQPQAPGLPASLIVDGFVNDSALQQIGAQEDWLRKGLADAGVKGRDAVLLASYDPSAEQLFIQLRSKSHGKTPQPIVQKVAKP